MESPQTVKEVITRNSNSGNKRRRSPVENLNFADEKKLNIIERVENALLSFDDNFEAVNEAIKNSDETNGKVQRAFDLLFGLNQVKDYNYYMELLTIHSKIFQGFDYLNRFMLENGHEESEQNILTKTLEGMYCEGGFIRDDLIKNLYDKRDYHLEFVKQGNEYLKRNNQKIMALKNRKIRERKDTLAIASNYL